MPLRRSPNRAALLALASLLPTLAACTQTASTGGGLGSGDCAGGNAAFRATLQKDLAAGKIARARFNHISDDLRQADEACAAGRVEQSRAILVTTKRNWRYE